MRSKHRLKEFPLVVDVGTQILICSFFFMLQKQVEGLLEMYKNTKEYKQKIFIYKRWKESGRKRTEERKRADRN